MIITLILAWILTLFKLDEAFVNAINQIFGTDYTTAIYWLLFLMIGILIYVKNE